MRSIVRAEPIDVVDAEYTIEEPSVWPGRIAAALIIAIIVFVGSMGYIFAAIVTSVVALLLLIIFG